jgi:hypothetical protein
MLLEPFNSSSYKKLYQKNWHAYKVQTIFDIVPSLKAAKTEPCSFLIGPNGTGGQETWQPSHMISLFRVHVTKGLCNSSINLS